MAKRKDLFFGLHFDFHACADDTVAKVFDPGSFEECLDLIKPDYVQCDTKGHPGISSYPTKVGTPARTILHDMAAVLRKMTRERGIALYAHHSGVYDEQAAKDHPDWAVVDENGAVSDSYMSVFSPYKDKILIPQLKELRDVYGFDGAWVDGECWASFVDFSPYALDAYRAAAGKEPPRPGEDGYGDYREFCRQGFRDYVARYIGEAGTDNFEITSNWLYSHYMPEKMTVRPPFLSGDFSPNFSPFSAREGGRHLAARGLPWDLLSWGSSGANGFEGVSTMKEAGQLCQEAALVVALGGGIQLYNEQGGRGGAAQRWAFPRWAKVAEFARKREFLHNSVPCSDVGVLVPDVRTGPDEPALFKVLDVSSIAWLTTLCESGYSPDAVFEADGEISDRIKLLAVPSQPSFRPGTVDLLKRFAARGGRLLVDRDAVRFFADVSPRSEDARFFVFDGEGVVGEQTPLLSVPGDALLSAYDDDFMFGEPFPVCVRKDGAALFCFDFARTYESHTSCGLRRALRSVVSSLGVEPLALADGDPYAELAVTEKDGDLFVTVTNTAGDHRVKCVRNYDRVPPLCGVTVTVKVDGEPNVEILPAGETKAVVKYEDGKVKITFDRIDISATVRIKKNR